MDIDYFLKKQALGGYPNIKPIFFDKLHHGVNAALLRIWAPHVQVITNRFAYNLLRPFRFFPPVYIDFGPVAGIDGRPEPAAYQAIVNQWGHRPPIFQLPDEMRAEGHRALRAMRVPEGAWFVPVHARDGFFAPAVEDRESYRNCDISNYSAAVDAIIARGGWCIRMGEKDSPGLPERPGLINYPETAFKSDWMDIFLCNQARFFLCNTSGLKIVSTISGVPCAAANMTPHDCVYGFLPADISIPKLLRLKDGTMPRFADIFASDFCGYHHAMPFADAGVTLIENTPQQIRDLATEMLDALDGNAQQTSEDEVRQETFRRLLTPRHHTYGTRSRIGSAFLREYAHLLD
jgi:putative glycosyltransferase (TIGR04372 family)